MKTSSVRSDLDYNKSYTNDDISGIETAHV